MSAGKYGLDLEITVVKEMLESLSSRVGLSWLGGEMLSGVVRGERCGVLAP